MPLVQRQVKPVYLCRGNVQDQTPSLDVDIRELINNNALGYTIKQLAEVVQHADKIFANISQEFEAVVTKSSRLNERVVKLSDNVLNLNAKKVKVPVGDLASFTQVNHRYESSYGRKEHRLLVDDTRNECILQLYKDCHVNPLHVIRSCDPIRTDGKAGGCIFSPPPIFQKEADRRKQLQTPKLDPKVYEPPKFREKVPIRDVKERPVSLSALSDMDKSTNSPVVPMPTPERQVRDLSRSQPVTLVPIDVSGSSFDRQSGYRASLRCVHREYDNDVRSLRKRNTPRRLTVSGVPGYVSDELLGNTILKVRSTGDLLSTRSCSRERWQRAATAREQHQPRSRSRERRKVMIPDPPRERSPSPLFGFCSVRKSLSSLIKDARSKSQDLWADGRPSSPGPPVVDMERPLRRSKSLPRSLKTVLRDSRTHLSSSRSASTEGRLDTIERERPRERTRERPATVVLAAPAAMVSTKPPKVPKSEKRLSRSKSFFTNLKNTISGSYQSLTAAANKSTVKRRERHSLRLAERPKSLTVLPHQYFDQPSPRQPIPVSTPSVSSASDLSLSPTGKPSGPQQQAWLTTFADVKLRQSFREARDDKDRQSSSGHWSASGSSVRYSSESDYSRSLQSTEVNSQTSLDHDSALSCHSQSTEQSDERCPTLDNTSYSEDTLQSNASTVVGDTSTLCGDDSVSNISVIEIRQSQKPDKQHARHNTSADPPVMLVDCLTIKNLQAHNHSNVPYALRTRHADEESSVFSVDQEGFYTSMHLDSGLRRSTADLVEEEGQDVSMMKPMKGKGKRSSHTKGRSTKKAPPPPPPRTNSLSRGLVLNESSSSGKDFPPPPTQEELDWFDTSFTIQKNESYSTSTWPRTRHTQDSESDTESIYSSRLRQKTSISSAAIPSLVAVTPVHSDDEDADMLGFCDSWRPNETNDNIEPLTVDVKVTRQHYSNSNDNLIDISGDSNPVSPSTPGSWSDYSSTWPRSPSYKRSQHDTSNDSEKSSMPRFPVRQVPRIKVIPQAARDHIYANVVVKSNSADNVHADGFTSTFTPDPPLKPASVQFVKSQPVSQAVRPNKLSLAPTTPLEDGVFDKQLTPTGPQAAHAKLIISSPVPTKVCVKENPHKRSVCSPVTDEELVSFFTHESTGEKWYGSLQRKRSSQTSLSSNSTVSSLGLATTPSESKSGNNKLSEPLFGWGERPSANVFDRVATGEYGKTWYDGIKAEQEIEFVSGMYFKPSRPRLSFSSYLREPFRPRKDSDTSTISSESLSRNSTSYASIHKACSSSSSSIRDSITSLEKCFMPIDKAGSLLLAEHHRPEFKRGVMRSHTFSSFTRPETEGDYSVKRSRSGDNIRINDEPVVSRLEPEPSPKKQKVSNFVGELIEPEVKRVVITASKPSKGKSWSASRHAGKGGHARVTYPGESLVIPVFEDPNKVAGTPTIKSGKLEGDSDQKYFVFTGEAQTNSITPEEKPQDKSWQFTPAHVNPPMFNPPKRSVKTDSKSPESDDVTPDIPIPQVMTDSTSRLSPILEQSTITDDSLDSSVIIEKSQLTRSIPNGPVMSPPEQKKPEIVKNMDVDKTAVTISQSSSITKPTHTSSGTTRKVDTRIQEPQPIEPVKLINKEMKTGKKIEPVKSHASVSILNLEKDVKTLLSAIGHNEENKDKKMVIKATTTRTASQPKGARVSLMGNNKPVSESKTLPKANPVTVTAPPTLASKPKPVTVTAPPTLTSKPEPHRSTSSSSTLPRSKSATVTLVQPSSNDSQKKERRASTGSSLSLPRNTTKPTPPVRTDSQKDLKPNPYEEKRKPVRVIPSAWYAPKVGAKMEKDKAKESTTASKPEGILKNTTILNGVGNHTRDNYKENTSPDSSLNAIIAPLKESIKHKEDKHDIPSTSDSSSTHLSTNVPSKSNTAIQNNHEHKKTFQRSVSVSDAQGAKLSSSGLTKSTSNLLSMSSDLSYSNRSLSFSRSSLGLSTLSLAKSTDSLCSTSSGISEKNRLLKLSFLGQESTPPPAQSSIDDRFSKHKVGMKKKSFVQQQTQLLRSRSQSSCSSDSVDMQTGKRRSSGDKSESGKTSPRTMVTSLVSKLEQSSSQPGSPTMCNGSVKADMNDNHQKPVKSRDSNEPMDTSARRGEMQ